MDCNQWSTDSTVEWKIITTFVTVSIHIKRFLRDLPNLAFKFIIIY